MEKKEQVTAAENIAAETVSEVKEETAAVKKPAAKRTRKTAAKKAEATEAAADKKETAKKPAAKKTAAKKTTARKSTAKKTTAKKAAPAVEEAPAAEAAPVVEETPAAEAAPVAEEAPAAKAAPAVEETPAAEAAPAVEETPAAEAAPVVEETPAAVEAPVVEKTPAPTPRRSIAFIGSECYPFVKTGGLGDVMYALPKALAKLNCDVKVIIPKYKCIPQKFQDKMVYRGSFYMDLCSDGRQFYVGIMEYVWDGVVYDFIDNEEFFSAGKPYTNLIDDIPKYCYFGKAALAALNFMNWVPDVIHCHDWQAALVPLYLRTMFMGTDVGRAQVITTIHNLRFQGIYNIETIQYWSGLPDYVFNKDCLTVKYVDANMLKGGLAYSNKITTVSNTYASEIQTPEYGEGLEEHLKYHSGKLSGIVNGIDVDIWNPETDELLPANYNKDNAIEQKKADKKALQERLGLEVDETKMVIGLISRLTNQKGLDLVNAVIPGLMDGNTQIVVLGTGDAEYENTFREYENNYKGSFCAYISYDEALSHQIYAGCDALLVPSRFEPCGLTQLIAMRYGSVPVVRETGGLKDTVEPYNMFENTGNGFTFDRYEADLLYDAINRAKTLYFTGREFWDEMVIRNMEKDVSWEKSAQQYKNLYLEITPRY